MEVPGAGHAIQQDPGFYTKREAAIGVQTATAAVGDGTEVFGPAVNRADPSVALSVIVGLVGKATLASGHDVVVTSRLYSRDDSSDSWHLYEAVEPADITITALNDGSAQDVEFGFAADLSAAKAEIRIGVKPNFSASGTDTLAFGGVYVLGGFDTNPQA